MKKLPLANLPTKIAKLQNLSNELGTNLYIKHDDQTGSELSGNKVRKLEYSIAEAKALGCDMLITTGGIQSNHCRATVSAATLLGMKSAVLLRISKKGADNICYKEGGIGAPESGRNDLLKPEVAGNYFMDKLLGADVHFCSPEEYSQSRNEIMETLAEKYRAKGLKPYIIPEGASNGVGALGYYTAMKEIIMQENEMGVKFDTIVVATGSGGTCAGLNMANRILGLGKRVIGMCVCDNNEYFQERIAGICNDSLDYLVSFGEIKPLTPEKRKEYSFVPSQIEMNDKYIGIGYALSRPQEMEFIKKVAQMEGIIFDTCYTGKGMYGVWNELQKGGSMYGAKNVLFIHTGGLFGLFPNSGNFAW